MANDFDIALKLRLDEGNATAGLRRFAETVKGKFSDLDKSAKGSGKAIDDAFRILGVKSAKQLQADIDRVRKAMDTLGKDSTLSGKEIAKAMKAGKTQIAALKAEAAGLGSITKSNALSMAELGKRATAAAAAYLSVRSAINAVKGIIETGASFETLGAQLNTLYGDKDKAKQALDWITNFTKNTPFQLDGVTQAFVKLKAFGLDPMDGTMADIVEQSSALGASQENLTSIVLALGQAWTKQKLEGDDILQLVNAGVPVWDLLAKVTGKNTAELQQLSQQGKLGRDVIRGLIDEMGKVNAGAAAAQMKTFNGQLSNLNDSWTQFQKTIADSGLLDYLKDELDSINQRMAEMSQNGELKAYAKEISDDLVAAAKAAKHFAEEVYHLRDVIGGVTAAWVALKVIRGGVGMFNDAAVAASALSGRMTLLKQAAGSAISPMTALTLLRFAPWVGLAATVGYLVEAKVAADNAYEALKRAEEEKKRYIQTTADLNAAGADAPIATQAQLDEMTAYERHVYSERLLQAQQYYEAKRQLMAQQPTTDPALAKQNLEQLHAYDQAIVDYKKYLGDRTKEANDFNARIATIKQKETTIIEGAIADQLKKYADANTKLKTLQNQRADILKQFAAAEASLSATPNAQGQPDLGTVAGLIQQARASSQTGDLNAALSQAQEARQLIVQLQQSGQGDIRQLKLYLDNAKEIALAANTQQQQDVQKQIDGYKASIERLKGAAEWMKHLTIGYDEARAKSTTEQLTKVLQAQLKLNPLVIPVTLAKPTKYDNQAAGIVNAPVQAAAGYATGGFIQGPGTGTSDSIIARISNGEYIVRAEAVRHFGVDMLHAINNLRLPKFSTGGLANLRIPELRVPSAPAAALAPSSGDTLYLTIGGQQIGPVYADKSVSRQFRHLATLYGGTK